MKVSPVARFPEPTGRRRRSFRFGQLGAGEIKVADKINALAGSDGQFARNGKTIPTLRIDLDVDFVSFRFRRPGHARRQKLIIFIPIPIPVRHDKEQKVNILQFERLPVG